MKTQDNDILKKDGNLKEMPFLLPEGYMESLRNELKTIPQRDTKKIPIFKRIIPYMSLAAAFAMIVTIGGFILEKTTQQDFSHEDYIVFSEDMTNTIFYDTEELYADALSDDDIIEYLIYTGVEIEELY
jgi:hypothetical protein